jgi:hypothetical protein
MQRTREARPGRAEHRAMTRVARSAALIACALLAAIAAGLLGGCAAGGGSGNTGSAAQSAAATPTTPPKSLAEVDAANAVATLDSTSTGHGPIVLFDLAHREIFGPTNTSPLGYSSAVERMRKAGGRVVVAHDPYTPEMLRDVSGVIIAGNMAPLTDAEQIALRNFVERGGVVLVATHLSAMDLPLARRFGIEISPKTLLERSASGADTTTLNANGIIADPLTEGVHSLDMMGAWALDSPSREASMLVLASPNTWMDINGDKQLTKEDPSGRFSVVAATRLGKGLFIVSGDDALFANLALQSADNRRMLDNLMRRMLLPSA